MYTVLCSSFCMAPQTCLKNMSPTLKRKTPSPLMLSSYYTVIGLIDNAYIVWAHVHKAIIILYYYMLKDFFVYRLIRLDMAYHIRSCDRYICTSRDAHTKCKRVLSSVNWDGEYNYVQCVGYMGCAYWRCFSPAIGVVNFLFCHSFSHK